MIKVGYTNGNRAALPEEQKMLNEIGRMLSLALERKELRERIALKQGEEEEYARKLSELEMEITSREIELEAQKQKLSTVDSYLGRVNETMEETSRRLETMFRAIPDKVILIDLNRNVVMSNREEIEPGEKCYRTCFSLTSPAPDCRLSKIVRNKTPITLTIRDNDRYLEVTPFRLQQERRGGGNTGVLPGCHTGKDLRAADTAGGQAGSWVSW